MTEFPLATFPSFQLLALEAFGKHRLREQMSYQCNPRLPAMGSIFLFPLLDFQNMLPSGKLINSLLLNMAMYSWFFR